jgi:hypothetical protein
VRPPASQPIHLHGEARHFLLPPDFEPEKKVKVKECLAKLHKMGVGDDLTEQQARQLNFDLDPTVRSWPRFPLLACEIVYRLGSELLLCFYFVRVSSFDHCR